MTAATTERPREQIIERIRKSLALSQSPNENEAALALKMAHDMLAKYNLDISEIQDVADIDPVEISSGIDLGTKAWRTNIWNAVGKANYCSAFLQSHGGGRGAGSKSREFFLVGRSVNIMAAKEMATWLTERMEAMARESLKEKPAYVHGLTWRRNYLEGSTSIVLQRLRALNTETAEPETTALTVRLDLEVKDFMDRKLGVMRPKHTQRSTDYVAAAYAKGAQDGRQVSLAPVKSVRGGR